MNKYKTMDANEAVSNVSYNFTEIAGIYPITPASTMAEKVDILSNSGKKNFFGERLCKQVLLPLLILLVRGYFL